NVVDQRDGPVAGAGEVESGQGEGLVRAVPVRRRAERLSLLWIDVGVELGDEVSHLLVGDDCGVRATAVTGGEGEVVGDPDLDVLADATQGVFLDVDDALEVVEGGQEPHGADRGCLDGGSGGTRPDPWFVTLR